MAGAAARSAWRGPAGLAGALAVLVLGGEWLYRLEVRDSVAVIACVFVAFYVPGSLLLSRAMPRAEWPLGHAVLALAAGLTVFPIVYRLLRQFDAAPAVLFLILAVQLAAWLVVRWRAWRSGEAGSPAEPGDLACLGLLLGGVLVLLHFSHFGDVLLRADGLSIRNSHLAESVFHLGLLNALTDVFPPPAIYAAGSEGYAHYHLHMHLQMELVARLGGVATVPLAYLYFPLIYCALLALLAFVFVRHLGGSRGLATVCGLLIFGSDGSFVPGLLLGPPGEPWTLYLPSTIYSTFTLNGLLPALIPLFAALTLLSRYFQGRGGSHLAVFALLTLGAYGLKASMGLQMAAAGLAAGAGCLWLGHDARRARALLGASGLVLLLLFAAGGWVASTSSANAIRLAPFGLLRGTLETLGLAAVDVVWYPVLLAAILLGALGVRALGVWWLARTLPARSPADGLLLYLAGFVVIGYAVSELFFIGRPGGLNNSVWFFIQSLLAAWFALFWGLAHHAPGTRRARLLALAAIALAAAPSTVQLLALRSVPRYADYGPDELAVVAFLKTTDPRSVVLHPLDLDRPSLAANLAGRSSVLSPFLSFVVEDEGLSRRGVDILTFFHAGTADAARRAILERYGVDYVYLPTPEAPMLAGLDALQPALRNASLSVFRVASSAEPADPAAGGRAAPD